MAQGNKRNGTAMPFHVPSMHDKKGQGNYT